MRHAMFRVIPALALLAALAGVAVSQGFTDVRLRIEHRQLVDSEETIRVAQGDHVRLHWTGDEPVELHLHGYDVTLELAPNETGVMTVDAAVPGRFPVTAHGFGGGHDHHTLLYLEIHPD